MPQPIPLSYTFGNHMHWVDMQWLWGYEVMPSSVADMLAYCARTGARGNVNFDGVGYEKLAAEAPQALESLRAAVQAGVIEPVGCSYGQPYGLFHGGESNVRQRVHGVRTVRRLLGVWPISFWEEEFDFFPQLPQMLRGVGMTHASLYFQWTWHTPELPVESSPVIQWEGLDGSRLQAASRHRTNLHQWPEDFAILLDELAAEPPTEGGLVLQWLELMPSPDWMCRAELMAPMLERLKADPRFALQFGTLRECLDRWSGPSPARQYRMGDAWHGLSLGKNGDQMRLRSARAETRLVHAEALAAIASLLGRPYAQWDVYPVWELEEAWRELLQAQHHDNDECEGLCGRVGMASYERAEALATAVEANQWRRLETVFGAEVGWGQSPFGLALGPSADGPSACSADEAMRTLGLDGLEMRWTVGGATRRAALDHPDVARWEAVAGGFDLALHMPSEQPDPGFSGAVVLDFGRAAQDCQIVCDTPYAVQAAEPYPEARRKYPSGDWMTSPQWFETVRGAFSALSLIDIRREDSGLLVLQDRTRQWLWHDGSLRMVLSLNDPWDEDYYVTGPEARLHLRRVGHLSHRDRAELSAAFRRRLFCARGRDGAAAFEPFRLRARGATLTALYREQASFAAQDGRSYAGSAWGYPFVVRIVEWNGGAEVAVLEVWGSVAEAWKTDLLGQPQQRLEATIRNGHSHIEVPLRPFEIATVMLDVEEGRKAPRDLDAHRHIWATVHRTEHP